MPMAPRDGGLDLWEAVLSRASTSGVAEDVLSLLRSASVQSCTADGIAVMMPAEATSEGAAAAEAALGRSAEELLGRRPAIDLALPQHVGARLGAAGWLAGIPRPVLNKNYSFDNFVIGPSNRLAHAAALAVSDAPGQAYNPLFLHSASGMGKTHLLQATCARLLENRPDTAFMYISCEDFQNLFLSAVQAGDLEGFRNRFRCAELLVVDDIHFLANRERSQEEFFHTFNALYNAARQIILSCDCPPREIPQLQERLVSRFKWGLVAEIEPPSFETRLEIIRLKAGLRGFSLPRDVMEYVAERSDSSIRELEGTVLKIVGYASLLGEAVDLGLAREVLEAPAARRAGGRQPGIEDIMDAVSEHYGVTTAQLQARGRTRTVTLPRQVCMYLARDMTSHSLEAVGAHFGGRDHSTVKHACDKIAELLTAGGPVANAVRAVRQRLSKRTEA
ncbi:MAG: chromosomal replication initiator protein DnaA [Planctomycetota bacterium]